MQKTTPLQKGKFYHIYNCGINGELLFRQDANYMHFLKLYDKYIEPIAETYAWCLMSNHFHLLVRVKDESDIKTLYEISHSQGLQPLTGHTSIATQVNGSVGDDWKARKPKPHNQLSHLFNAYAQHINTKYTRHGSLFERPFKRKPVENDVYLKQLVVYIHNNPVHHGFCDHPYEYPWSSYHTCISKGKTKLRRNEVLKWFEDIENFKYVHTEKADVTALEKWLGD